jgi:hypothetical protein
MGINERSRKSRRAAAKSARSADELSAKSALRADELNKHGLISAVKRTALDMPGDVWEYIWLLCDPFSRVRSTCASKLFPQQKTTKKDIHAWAARMDPKNITPYELRWLQYKYTIKYNNLELFKYIIQHTTLEHIKANAMLYAVKYSAMHNLPDQRSGSTRPAGNFPEQRSGSIIDFIKSNGYPIGV